MDKHLQAKLAHLIDRLDTLLPNPVPLNFNGCYYRWLHSHVGIGHLVPASAWQTSNLKELWGLDDEINQLRANTEAFVTGKRANHALLTGPRGCGKTSIVHGVASEFSQRNLIVIRMGRDHLVDLPLLAAAVADRKEYFLIVCDELSFGSGSDGHLATKSALDELEGGLARMLVYATSNRRHLIPEDASENLEAYLDDGNELHPGETTEEKISLSDRFGLWIPVFAPDQEQYIDMVRKWFVNHGSKQKIDDKVIRLSLQWARERGSFNGRIARQFVTDRLAR